jgi:hypothetical protein
VLPLFSNSGWGESSNIAFLEKHMGVKLARRKQPLIANFSKDDIKSGDFLAMSKIRGRWGAFETLEKWVTGAYAGHTAVCLRDEDGELWVGESGHENEKVCFSQHIQKSNAMLTSLFNCDRNAMMTASFNNHDRNCFYE